MGESLAQRPIARFPTCFRRGRITRCNSGGRILMIPPLTTPPTPARILWASGLKVFHLHQFFFASIDRRKCADSAHLLLSPQSSSNFPVPQLLHLPHSNLGHRRSDLLPHPLPHHQCLATFTRGRKLHLGQPVRGGPRRVSGSGISIVDRDDVSRELLGHAEHDCTRDPRQPSVSGVFPRWRAWAVEAIHAKIRGRPMDQ